MFGHDIKYIQNPVTDAGINEKNIIDTLFLSPLLFPAKPYHSLLKDEKLQTEEINNPLNDSKKAQDLFNDEVAVFHRLNDDLKQIFYYLLHDKKEFKAFFNFLGYKADYGDVEDLIRTTFNALICENTDLKKLICEYPVELSYCLALINTISMY